MQVSFCFVQSASRFQLIKRANPSKYRIYVHNFEIYCRKKVIIFGGLRGPLFQYLLLWSLSSKALNWSTLFQLQTAIWYSVGMTYLYFISLAHLNIAFFL